MMKDVLIAADGHTFGREEQIVNVRDYGAVGDGTVDDTAGFQEAADAALAGGMVFVPAGTYNISEVILPDYVSLVGLDNRNCTLKATIADTEYVIKTGSYSVIADIGVENNCISTTATESSCILVDNDTCDIINCRLAITTTCSVSFSRASALHLTNDAICNIWASDILCTATLSGLTAFTYGIHCEASIVNGRLLTINPSPADGSGYGILIASTGTGRFYSCDIRGVGVSAYYTGTIVCEDCHMECTGGNNYPVVVVNDNGYFYNCTMKKHGTATYCIGALTAANIRVAHCRMNLGSPLHANLTNLIETPYNVADTDV